jgi:rod shape-determining protein MreC
MEPFLSRFKNPLVLIAILLVQSIALATQVRRPVDALRPDGQHVRLVRLWANALISPFEELSTFVGQGVRNAWADYVDLRHARQEGDDLKKQVAQLKLERAAISEDAVEAHRLRQLLDFKQHYITTTVAAQVIGTSGSDQSRLLILDKGANDGLKPGMPVITPDGVVGKLRDVFATTSQLLLLSDPTSGAGVFLQSTRTRAILKGSATGQIVIGNLTPDDRIKPGEKVLTSGGDLVFPRGLSVGTVESVKLDPDHQPYTLITLKPAANLNQLEEVLVVTATGNSLDPKTEQELAADAEVHAADVSAERLPSLHEKGDAADGANAGADATPPPDNSTQLVPKPKPVIHPDKYSPGSAPPASELQPGGGTPATAPPATPPSENPSPATPPQSTPPQAPPPASPAPRSSGNDARP